MRNLSVKSKVLTIVISTIIIISLIISIQSIISINNLTDTNVENYKKEAYALKEDELKNYVSMATKTVESYHSRTSQEKIKNEVSNDLQDQTNFLFSVLEDQYKRYKGKVSQNELKTKLKDIVKATRYGKNGYFWINDFDTKIVMHPLKSHLNGKSKKGVKHWDEFVEKGKLGDGFVSYVQSLNGKKLPKVSYVKTFKPFNWIIGTGAYVDDITGNMKKEALKAISGMRYGKSGYFWINDSKPNMIMHPIKPSLDGKDLSTLKDPNGVYLFNDMVKVCSSNGEGLVKYSWAKPGYDKPQAKFSYVKEFKQWGWIIGTGTYVDDIEAKVLAMQKNGSDQINSIIIQIIIIALIIAIISSIIVSIIST
ncbi:MAG: cache domain-containing protein, partial [Campylobacterota bacterium]|nr:cache domain-containing protein [Campylobacterota bacterium]